MCVLLERVKAPRERPGQNDRAFHSGGCVMNTFDQRSSARPDPDPSMLDIARYVADYTVDSREAFDTARYMLLDSLACAALAMDHAECVRHLGPLVPGADLKGGARVRSEEHTSELQ